MQTVQMISLNQLVYVPKKNVRRTVAPNGQSIEQLAASIRHTGLKQNLVVAPITGKDGRYSVSAGGRRLRALQLLVKQHHLKADEKVPCRVESEDAAIESSLIENVQREAMHPLDEFEAFAQLVRDGMSVDVIAERFGVSVLRVQQRLKLLTVAPALLAVYRDGQMTLEQLMAFTVSDDHAAQCGAWFGYSAYMQTPREIRNRLTQGEADAETDPRVRVVTLAAYEAAGGIVRRDLFRSEHPGYASDAALLDKLYAEKLDTAAEAVRAEGWSWVEVATSRGGPSLYDYDRSQPKQRDPTKAEARELKSLSKECDKLRKAINALYDANEDEESERMVALHAQLEAAETRHAEIEATRQTFSDCQKKKAGALVFVREGALCIERGLVKPVAKKASKRNGAAGSAECDGDGADSAADDTTDTGAALSERLRERLSAQRTVALQAVLAGTPKVALVVVTHALATEVFYAAYRRYTAVEIKGARPAVESSNPTLASCDAWQAIEQDHAHWLARLPKSGHALWPWLLAEPESTVLALLAYVVARHVNVLDKRHFCGQRAPDRIAGDDLARTLGLDMRNWWKPTGDNYLAHVPKALVLDALREAGHDAEVARLSKAKKAPLVAEAAQLLADTGWLPAPLRAPGERPETREDEHDVDVDGHDDGCEAESHGDAD